MPGTKGNKNALKHGLYAGSKNKPKKPAAAPAQPAPPHKPDHTIAVLDDVLARIYDRLKTADDDHFAALANSLASCATAIFNGHRTLAFLNGNAVPIDEAIKELQALDFAED